MLTTPQLKKLRRYAGDEPNRLRYAMSLTTPKTTQVQLAEAVDLTQSYISCIANGDYSQIPLETARNLARHFGCAIEDLFPAREAIAS